MKKALAIAAMLLFATAAPAALYVELDGDGTLGNGPDVVGAVVSDIVAFDVWIVGDAGGGGMFSFGVILCNFDGSLEFVSTTYNVGGWSVIPPQPGPCPTLQATDFSGASPIFFPAMIGTVTYHYAVDNSLDDITLDVSGILGYDFMEYLYDNNGQVVAQVGMETGTQESSWGAVKGLFR